MHPQKSHPSSRLLAACATLVLLQCLWLVGEAVETQRRADVTEPPLLYSDPPFARVTSAEGDLGRTPVTLRLVPGTEVSVSRLGYTAVYRIPDQGPRHGEVVTLSPTLPVLSPLLLRYPLFTMAAVLLAAGGLRKRETDDDGAIDLRPGGRLGPYALVECLDDMSLFPRWRARRRGANADVALTAIPATPLPPALRRHIEGSAHLLLGKPHPSIERVVDVGQHLDALYLATELLRGETLEAWARTSPRSPREAVEKMAAVLDAVAHAHDLGLSHGSLDGSQIVITDDGVPHVRDFCLGGVRVEKTHATNRSDTRGRTQRTEATEVTEVTGATEVTDNINATAVHPGSSPGGSGPVRSAGPPPPPSDLQALGGVLHGLLGGDVPAPLHAACRRMQETEGPYLTLREARQALLACLDEARG